MSATAKMSPAASPKLNFLRSATRVNNADGGQPVDGVLHGKAGQNDLGDVREYHCDLAVQLPFGEHGQAQDKAGSQHHCQQLVIVFQRSGKPRIDDNYRHGGRQSGEKHDG